MEWFTNTKVWVDRNKKYTPLIFFFTGFLFDLVTLGRIDQSITLVQQAGFLFLLGGLLYLESFYPNEAPTSLPNWMRKRWHHRVEAVHFFFGSLLSAYTIFYLKSASLFTSLIFVLFLGGLMVINELPRFRRTDLTFKFVLYTLCLVSYFIYLVPTLIGFMGLIPFSLSILATSLVLAAAHRVLKKRGATPEFLLKRFSAPSGITLLVFIAFYFLQWIPPVPLSAHHVGIYHDIKKEEGTYLLVHERPFWRVWHNGDQHFRAAPGDTIYCFTKIFSPTGFKDKIVFHWFHKNPKLGWQSMDKIPITVKGGRDQGFRGYAQKGNYQPGRWKIQIETLTGHEIARIYFEVEDFAEPIGATESFRPFSIDRH